MYILHENMVKDEGPFMIFEVRQINNEINTFRKKI